MSRAARHRPAPRSPALVRRAAAVAIGVAAAAPAWAQEDDAPPAPTEAPEGAAEEPAASEPKGDPAFTLEGPWNPKPYIRPVVGAMLLQNAVGVNLGAEAGFKYQQEKPDPVFFGRTRALGTYTLGSFTGYAAHLGSFFGPFYKIVGAQMGPDVFISQYQITPVAGTGQGVQQTVDQVVGLDWPVTALLDLKVFNAYAGVSPGWYLAGDRERLNNAIHQYALYAGIGLDLKAFGITLGWSRQVLADFTSQGFSAGLRL